MNNTARMEFIKESYPGDAEMMTECFERMAMTEGLSDMNLSNAAEICITSHLLKKQRDRPAN